MQSDNFDNGIIEAFWNITGAWTDFGYTESDWFESSGQLHITSAKLYRTTIEQLGEIGTAGADYSLEFTFESPEVLTASCMQEWYLFFGVTGDYVYLALNPSTEVIFGTIRIGGVSKTLNSVAYGETVSPFYIKFSRESEAVKCYYKRDSEDAWTQMTIVGGDPDPTNTDAATRLWIIVNDGVGGHSDTLYNDFIIDGVPMPPIYQSLVSFSDDAVIRSYAYEERSFSYVEPVVTRSFSASQKILSFVKSYTQRSFEEDEVT